MNSFLEGYIWSVPIMGKTEDNFYFVEKVYYYDSNSSNYNFKIEPGCLQIPDFVIKNKELLQTVDFEILNKNRIPVLKQMGDSWEVNLEYYEKHLNI